MASWVGGRCLTGGRQAAGILVLLIKPALLHGSPSRNCRFTLGHLAGCCWAGLGCSRSQSALVRPIRAPALDRATSSFCALDLPAARAPLALCGFASRATCTAGLQCVQHSLSCWRPTWPSSAVPSLLTRRALSLINPQQTIHRLLLTTPAHTARYQRLPWRKWQGPAPLP